MVLPVKGKLKMFGGGRNWIILVFSLLLAFFMWSIMKLSANYSSYVRYRLTVTTDIPGRKNVAESGDVLVIGAKSTGFRIIQNLQDKEALTLLVEGVDHKHLHKYGQEGDMFYLIPDNIRQKIQDALGADIKVETLATDTLFFIFPEQGGRKVPVEPKSIITYGKQHMPYSKLLLKPDSVFIYGDAGVISGIDRVYTQAIRNKNVSGSISGIVELAPMDGVRFSVEEVFYSQEIGRYVENTVKVPVTIGDAPSYANVAVIPQEVTIRYRQQFGKSVSLSPQDFAVEVGYDEIMLKDVVKPRAVKMPEGILEYEIEPKFVECVL